MSLVWDMRRVDAVRALRVRAVIDRDQLVSMSHERHRGVPTALLEELVHDLRHARDGIGALIHPEDLVIERHDDHMHLQVVFTARWDPSIKDVLLVGGGRGGHRLVFTKAPHDPLFLVADEEREPWTAQDTPVELPHHEVWEPAGWDTQQRTWIYERTS